MTNYIDATGLHLQSLEEIITELETGFRAIYGANINLEPNSPDAQMINLFAQAKIDILDTISQVYNSFSPNAAVGTVLDQRVAINGIARQGATNTVIEVEVTTDRVVNLVAGQFIVADDQGNQFAIMANQTTIAGVNTYLFEAVVPGNIIAVNDTVTNVVTVTLGVTAVNNPNDTITQGSDQETDAALRFRRMQSVAIPSTGYLEGLVAALKNIVNVTGATVIENDTNVVDAYGTDPHTIWCIVDGGTDADIADVIYAKRNAGCGMRGDEIVPKTTPSGFNMAIKFDRPIYIDLYIEMTVTSTDPSHIIDVTNLKNQIAAQVLYNIYEPADFTEITAIAKAVDPYVVVTAGGVSDDDITYQVLLFPDVPQGRFIASTTRIDITVV